MQLLTVAAAALNQTPLDWVGNVARIRACLTEAKAAGAAIVCLPELCLTGYGCEDAFHGLGVCERALDGVRALLPDTEGIATILGLPIRWHGALYNCVALAVDGKLTALVAKQHLAGDGIHYEPRWFKPWPAGQRVAWRDGDLACPLGDIYADLGGLRIGFEICEDAWVAQRPGSRLASRALDLLLNPSASHFAFGKFAVRQRIVAEGSRALGVTYCYANLLGNEAGRVIYDGGPLIASGGRLAAVGERLSFRDHVLILATVDVAATRRAQAATASFRTEVADEPGACVQVPWTAPRGQPQAAVPAAAWESGPHLKEEEFARAEALGLADYVRKSRSRGVVISLSGGADSAAVACLVRLAWHWGEAAWGAGWRARLGLPAEFPLAAWCTCVYQATVNSGATTHDAARTVAAALDAGFHAIEVEELVQGYERRVEGMLGRRLDWGQDDIARQNIQARARAPGVWMLANCLGALLLATSNRSEAAVGYATMDGDTCGGLSPIAGIDKAFLRQWLRWLQTTGPAGAMPVPALEVVNRLVPTAELRPAAAGQTDEDDLMPYPVLDAIERLAIRDKHPPADCLTLLAGQYPEHPRAQLALWVRRFFSLWCRNQWKRERYAPSFHLDDENLDPKTWCRFPILSGGFAVELAALS